jgi:signal transduction histidine kinase
MDLVRYQARWRQVRSVAGLAALTWAVGFSTPRPGLTGRGAVVFAALVLAAAGWFMWLFLVDRTMLMSVGLVVCAVAGVALTITSPRSAAIGYLCGVCISAGARLPVNRSGPLTAAVIGGYAVGQVALNRSLVWLAVAAAALVVCWLAGLVRRQVEERAEQRELLLAETQLAREEQARAAALAERARIAREIHDVLAHALAALSVQLETADALLESGRTEQARATVARARQLTREGLAETRRAISALRGDALPLPALLTALVEGYAADTGAAAESAVEGSVRDLAPDVALALYRTAQEALTNVRKHAPGASVSVRLAFGTDDVRLTVTDSGAPPGPAGGAVGGYGLTGLRERAELAGGTFSAGPSEDSGWRVEVVLPVAAPPSESWIPSAPPRASAIQDSRNGAAA